MVRTMCTKLPTWQTSQYAVVALPAEVDASNADDVREHLLTLLNAGGPGASPLIADLTDTTFCDSSAINALLRANTRAGALGRRLYAAVPPGGVVRKVFEITGIPRAIPVCDDIGSAIAMAVVTSMDGAQGGEPSTTAADDRGR
jgi:anti-sigma B factor antagonist